MLPHRCLRQGTEEINRTTLKTPHLELLQAITASTGVLLRTLQYSEQKGGKSNVSLQTHNAAEVGKQSPDSIKSSPKITYPEHLEDAHI